MVIYPNPSQDGIFNLSISELKGKSKIEVYTPQSQLLLNRNIDLSSGILYKDEVNMQGKPAGVYYLKLTNRETIIVKKLIIQK
jgi:hypothetical protein